MPNYNTHFSEVIPHLTREERAWLERALQDPDTLGDQGYEAWREEFGDLFEEPECGHGFGHEFDDNAEWGNHLWLYSEDSGTVENVIGLVQAFLEKFRRGQTWSITWAQTCSRPLVGEFGGGWAVATAERVESGSAWSMAEECKRALEHERSAGANSRPCPYCSAPMGEPEMGYDQDGASVAVWRCQKCGAEEHITRYPPEEPSEDGDLDESAGEERVAVCQNCGQVWPEPALRPIRDVEQRVAPGEPMPAGECPECGTLCHYGGGDVQ